MLIFFNVLEENKTINTSLCNELKEKAGFRNVLAHEYANIINEKVYKHLQELEVFEKFAKTISEKFL
ncbi:hypothetical protein AKJ50_02085 [candidate division MSBL1 archaeon SCGC-AAA382A13]|uniref:DUF86 domain-containing protein n=1 Tax=candidate division MSBL1 archaeon SCGC-AAA382A13 TaxID=1698279 RepID=A0A133VE69_9EURY|nr:hypothetical protein AKJ50_02085 [candidate division MSBL1 archaeon SCGC-AAA382A13]